MVKKLSTATLEKQAPKRIEAIENFIKNSCKSLNFELLMSDYDIEDNCEFITIELVNRFYTCDTYLSVRIENKKVVLFESDYSLVSTELSGYDTKDKFKDYYSIMIELDKLIDFITAETRD